MNAVLISIVIIISIFVIASIVGIKVDKDKNRHKHSSYRQYYYESNRQYNKREQEAFGKYGEYYVANVLSEIIDQYGGYIINDFTFKDERGYSTNIDHILICNGGVFVIETKSNKGVICGNVDQDLWYAKKENSDYYKTLKNPIKQNQGHINHLRRMMGDKPPKMFSIVIFPMAEYIENNSTIVHTLESAYQYIIERIIENHYSEQFIEKVYKELRQIKNEYGISLEEHKNNIRRMYNN